jgi:hypothetical protein
MQSASQHRSCPVRLFPAALSTDGRFVVRIIRLLPVACALALLLPAAQAQDLPKPGPEHARLKQIEGTWDATVKMNGQESKGTMKYKMGLGGLWLIADFEGDVGGMKFQGHGLDSYDAGKKKYVSVWADSFSTTPMTMEGTYDEKTKTQTMVGEGAGMDGPHTKFKSVIEFKDANTMAQTMSTVGKDGKDNVMLTITYKRRK